MNLNVQQVATRQLESAVWMYAYDLDEVAIHTVACTAYELLLFRLKQGEFIGLLNKKQKNILRSTHFKENNFFKHGQINYDDIEEVDFDPKVTEDVIMFACEANLKGPEEFRLQCAYVYLLHYSFRNKNVFSDEYTEEIRSKIKENKVTLPMEDKQTLKMMLGLIKDWRFPKGVKV